MAEEGQEIEGVKTAGEVPKKQGFEQKRVEVVMLVKKGEDEEGALLRGLFMEEIESGSESLGAVSKTYNQAQESAKNIEDPGEVNKLQIALRTLHKQANLDEYEIEIPEGLASEERQRLIKDRLLQDLRDLLDRMADHYMDDYYDQKTKLEIQGDGLRETLGSGDISRGAARVASYRQEREGDRLLDIENNVLSKLDRRDRLSDLLEPRLEKRLYKQEQFKGLKERDEEERNRLVEQRVGLFREQIRKERGESVANLYENLGQENKEELIAQLLDVELREQHLRDGLEDTISSGVAETICEQASQIRQSRLELERVQTEINIALTSQRVADSIESFNKARVELGKKLARFKDPRAEIKKTIASYIAIVSSVKGVSDQVLRKEVEPILNKLARKKESTKELAGRFFTTVDSVYEKTGRRYIDAAKKSLRAVGERFKAEFPRAGAAIERKKVDTKRWFYEKRHSLAVNRQRNLSLIGIEILTAKKHASAAVERLVSTGAISKEEGEKLKDQHQRIENLRDELIKRRGERYERQKAQNPHFKKLDDELERHIRVVESVAEEPKEEARVLITPPPLDEAARVLITPPQMKEEEPKSEEEEVEEVSKDKHAGTEVFSRFNESLEERRENIKDARENFEEARKPFLSEEVKVKGRETSKSRRVKYGKHYDLALNEYASILFAFNRYLNARIKTRGKNEDIKLFERYGELDTELGKLAERYASQFKDLKRQKPLTSPEEREGLLREYDRKLTERVDMHRKLSKQRGLSI